MKVTIRFFTILKDLTQKNKEEIEVPPSTTVEELISLLSKIYGLPFENYVYTQDGQIKPYLQILVNWINITTQHGFKTKLKENDEFAIIPPVTGGSTIGDLPSILLTTFNNAYGLAGVIIAIIARRNLKD